MSAVRRKKCAPTRRKWVWVHFGPPYTNYYTTPVLLVPHLYSFEICHMSPKAKNQKEKPNNKKHHSNPKLHESNFLLNCPPASVRFRKPHAFSDSDVIPTGSSRLRNMCLVAQLGAVSGPSTVLLVPSICISLALVARLSAVPPRLARSITFCI